MGEFSMSASWHRLQAWLYARWLPCAAWACRVLPQRWTVWLAEWLGPAVCAEVCAHMRVEEVAELGAALPAEFVADITAFLPRPLARQLLIYLPAPQLRAVMGVLLARGAKKLAALVADAIAARISNPRVEAHRR